MTMRYASRERLEPELIEESGDVGIDAKDWVIFGLVAATFTVLLLAFGVAYSFASFFDGLEADFQASRGDVSLVFSIAGFLYFSLGAISGPLSDRVGARPVVAFGIVLIAIGLLASSFAQNLWQIYLSYGAAVGVGIGFAYVPSVGVLQRWFGNGRAPVRTPVPSSARLPSPA